MKNTFLFIATLMILASCDNGKSQYINYNDAVVKEVQVADSTLQVVFSFREFEEFPEKAGEYQTIFSKAGNRLSQITWDEEDSLRSAARELVTVYQQIVNTDYSGIYYLMHDTIYTTKDSLKVDSLSKEMYAKWQIQSEHFASIQKNFSKKFGIPLSK